MRGEDWYCGAGGAWYWVGGQLGLGKVRGGILGGGGVGILTGRVAGCRGVVAEHTGGVNAACAQEEHPGADPLCCHILTTVMRSIADTAYSSGSHAYLMTLHNPVESLVALLYLPTAAPIVFSKKKHHCSSFTMLCVLLIKRKGGAGCTRFTHPFTSVVLRSRPPETGEM